MLKANEPIESEKVIDQPRSRRKASVFLALVRLIIQFVLMIAIVAVSIWAIREMMERTPERKTGSFKREPINVTAQTSSLQENRPNFTVFGRVVATNTLEIKSPVVGTVVEIGEDLQTGRAVREGQLLFKVDDFIYQTNVSEAESEIAQTQAAIREAEFRLVSERQQLEGARELFNLAAIDLERAKNLLKRGASTQKAIEEKQSTLNQRRLSIQQRESNIDIEVARQDQQRATLARLNTKLERAKIALDDTRIISPISGVISFNNIQLGREVGSQETYIRIDQEKGREIEFTVTDSQLGRLLSDSEPIVGRTVDILWSPGGEPVQLKGRINRVGAEVAASVGGAKMFAVIEGNAPDFLRPGSFVRLKIPDKSYPNSVRVPEEIIYNGSLVYIINDKSRLEPRTVRVAGYENGEAIIVSGVDDGEKLLTTRLSRITGRPVRVVDQKQKPSLKNDIELPNSLQNKARQAAGLSAEEWEALSQEEKAKHITSLKAGRG